MEFKIAKKNTDFKGSPMPSEWNTFEASSFEIAVDKYCNDEMWVHDCDDGSDYNEVIAVKHDKVTRYFTINHDFWADRSDGEFTVQNYFTVKEIYKQEAKIPEERDWISVRQTSYPEHRKWPFSWPNAPKYDLTIDYPGYIVAA